MVRAVPIWISYGGYLDGFFLGVPGFALEDYGFSKFANRIPAATILFLAR